MSGALTLYRMEIRALLRDSRTIFVSIVLPLLIMPLVLAASSRIKRSNAELAERRVTTYAIIAGPLHDRARELVEAAGRLGVPLPEPGAPDSGGASNKGAAPELTFKPESDPVAALRDGVIDVAIEGITEEEAAERARTEKAEAPGDAPIEAAAETPARPASVVLVLHYREDRPSSRAALVKVRSLLKGMRADGRRRALAEKGYDLAQRATSLEEVLPIAETDVATEQERTGSRTGRFLTALLVLFMLVGGGSIASDSIAGEKERGTLETLLSAGAGRLAIITSKLLIVLTATLATTVVQVANLYVCVALGLVDASQALGSNVTWGTALLLVALYLPVSALISSVLVLTFGMAGSYKEAQLYFLPVTIIGPVLALAPALPGIELRSAIVIVPLVNLSVAVREVLLGKIDWPMLAIAWGVTALAAAQIARASASLLSAERLLVTTTEALDPKDGDARLRRRVLHWFAALWSFVLLASIAGSGTGVFRSLVMGQLVFLAAVFVIVRRYGLDPRKALSLRMPKPLVWPAVLLGAPAAAIVATGLFQLASPALRVSDQSVEELSRAMFPEGMPLWQIALAIAVLPPICEELLFRGVLLHGLRKRLGPVWLCITVGVIFGIFHLALFRLVTTTFLGIVITAVALLTGSVLPGILWHAVNNALPLLLLKSGNQELELPMWSYPAATAVLMACLWVIWKQRTPDADPRLR
jgi:sodium transport system permease protein